MRRYLVVAHQTATSPELLEKVTELARGEPSAAFAILVPATPVQHLLVWEEGETQEVAWRQGYAAKSLFESRGMKVERVIVGDASPLAAIDDELRLYPDGYDGIVLSTLPPAISRWLKLDAHTQAERRFDLPVFHVIAKRRDAA
jgi:hypothetical protein